MQGDVRFRNEESSCSCAKPGLRVLFGMAKAEDSVIQSEK